MAGSAAEFGEISVNGVAVAHWAQREDVSIHGVP